jgi:hypothetical protein
MISNFINFTALTQNTATLPITPAEVRAVAQYFRSNKADTTFDADITQIIIDNVINWERETSFLLWDCTFKVFIYDQFTFNHKFIARLPVLNVYSVDSIKYHPCDWNYTDAKITLDPNLYFTTPEAGTDPTKFQLRNCNLRTFELHNNLEFNGKGGYANNNFTNMPLDIKRALILNTADVFDENNGFCKCNGGYYDEVLGRYKKHTAYNISITI